MLMNQVVGYGLKYLGRRISLRPTFTIATHLYSSRGNDNNDWVPYKPTIDVTKPNSPSSGDQRRSGSRDKREPSSDRKYKEADSSWGNFRKSKSDFSSGRREEFKPSSEFRPARDSKPRSDFRQTGKPDFRSSRPDFRQQDYRPRSADSRSDRSPENRFPKPWETAEKTEPVYGHYDGDHLYGINPVRLALKSSRRKMKELILQEEIDTGNKKESVTVREIIALAEEKGVPVRYFSKHDLNMMSDNRPHQGVILRASPLQFHKADTLPATDKYKVVLALDEVWDPQNFGALLRTSYFLGCDAVVVCAKNSAPLSPAVSKASAGVMELINVLSTDNMMRWLDNAKENGWQVIGTDVGETAVPFKTVPLTKPTILVLGNEGHGVRTNVLRRCDHLVSVEKKSSSLDEDVRATMGLTDNASDGVDSLNVSVTGGILLHHLTSQD